jgi:Protein of unknown function (DUF3311).
MNPRPRSVLVALVIPVVAVILGVSLIGPSSATVFGIPALFIFMFVMFPVTSALMAFTWKQWDQFDDYDADTATHPEEQPHATEETTA